jgi:hypothetical protein
VRSLGTLLAAICAILFVLASVLALLLFNLEQKAFSAETYKQAFATQGLYQRMPTILGTTITDYVAQNGSALPFLQVLTVEDWQNSIATLLPPEELQGMANNALDSTFGYLNGVTDSATISLLPIKTRLAGDAGTQIVLQVLQRQPACTAEQLTQMAMGLLGGQVVLCNPPEQALGLMMPFIQSQLQTLIGAFPNEVTFIPSAASTASGTPADPRIQLNTARSALKLTPFLPAFLLLGIAVFAIHSLIDWLTWWGWPFMIAGGISVLIGLFGASVIGGILQLVIQAQATLFVPPVLAASIAETAGAVAREILTPVVIEGFVLGIAGLGMVIAANLLARRERERMLRALNTNIAP